MTGAPEPQLHLQPVWCYCYDSPEPETWVFPDDAHADGCERPAWRTAAQLRPGDVLTIPIVDVDATTRPGSVYASVEFPWAPGQLTVVAMAAGLRIPDPGAGPPPPEAPPALEPADAARTLAELSGHPRYTHAADGWRQLLGAPALVEHAYAAAGRRGGAVTDTMRACRDALLLATVEGSDAR